MYIDALRRENTSSVGASYYEKLLNSWFPEGGRPPTAFLVDTSEEALLLPDWLKLRMIRSTSLRLVEAGEKIKMKNLIKISLIAN